MWRVENPHERAGSEGTENCSNQGDMSESMEPYLSLENKDRADKRDWEK